MARIDGLPVFVPFAAEGDLCKIKIEKVNKNYAFGRLVKIIRPSANRVEPQCGAYCVCGGCGLRHISFGAENAFKKKQLETTLRKAGITAQINDIVFGKSDGYRNKLQMPFSEKDGRIAVGFYKKSTHEVVPLERCPLHGGWAEKLIAAVTDWANGGDGRREKTVYCEQTGEGLLRHLVARYADGFLSVTIVINGTALPDSRVLYAELARQFECALYVCRNTAKTNVIMSGEVKLLHGKERALNIDGIFMEVSPLSFMQINDEIRAVLYRDVDKLLLKTDLLFDLYSGAGLLTAMLAKQINSAVRPCVYGVEIIKEATSDADMLMLSNGLSEKVKNICGDAAEILPDLVYQIVNNNKKTDKPSISVIVDPPRKGCDKKVLEAIISSKADRVIYISCNPATLARDLNILKITYEITSVTPYNMFPRTPHIETLCCLTLKNS